MDASSRFGVSTFLSSPALTANNDVAYKDFQQQGDNSSNAISAMLLCQTQAQLSTEMASAAEMNQQQEDINPFEPTPIAPNISRGAPPTTSQTHQQHQSTQQQLGVNPEAVFDALFLASVAQQHQEPARQQQHQQLQHQSCTPANAQTIQQKSSGYVESNQLCGTSPFLHAYYYGHQHGLLQAGGDINDLQLAHALLGSSLPSASSTAAPSAQQDSSTAVLQLQSQGSAPEVGRPQPFASSEQRQRVLPTQHQHPWVGLQLQLPGSSLAPLGASNSHSRRPTNVLSPSTIGQPLSQNQLLPSSIAPLPVAPASRLEGSQLEDSQKLAATNTEDYAGKVPLRFRYLMLQSEDTQRQLQDWDKKNGLPKSHSCTMVKTSRSRRQLLEGKILPKWDGTPLISEDGDATLIVKPRQKKCQRKLSIDPSPNDSAAKRKTAESKTKTGKET